MLTFSTTIFHTRSIFLFPAGTLLPAGYLLYGLPAEHRVFWLVPCIGLAFIGAGMIGFFQPTQLYIIVGGMRRIH